MSTPISNSTRMLPLKQDDKAKINLSKLAAIVTAIIGLLTAYTHFFGLSYWKSYLEGAGFEALTINLAPPETIYYATQGITSTLSRLLRAVLDLEIFKIENSLLGIAISLAIFLYFYLKKEISKSKLNQLSIRLFFRNKLDRWTDKLLPTLALSLVGFIAGYIVQILFITALLILLSFMWMIMYLGIEVGKQDGTNRVQNSICDVFDWENYNEGRKLGCRTVNLNDGTTLEGLRLFTNNNTTYLITNEGSYEITNGIISSFRPIHIKPEKN